MLLVDLYHPIVSVYMVSRATEKAVETFPEPCQLVCRIINYQPSEEHL